MKSLIARKGEQVTSYLPFTLFTTATGTDVHNILLHSQTTVQRIYLYHSKPTAFSVCYNCFFLAEGI